MKNIDWKLFDAVLEQVRAYFILQYHAGTREMIYRFVVGKTGDVDPLMVSAALKILKDRGAITFEKKVWWFLADK